METEPKPYRFVSKVDVETSRYLLRIVIEREPPVGWSLIVGDFVQNLRAALDHLVWQLVRANGQQPGRSIAFPIFDQEPPMRRGHRERERWKAMTRGVHPAALRFIERLQPYSPGGDGPSRNVLTALRKLSNEDKHRTILSAFSAIEHREPIEIDVVGVRDVRTPVEGGQVYAGRALKSYDLVLEAPVEIIGPNPEVKLEGTLPMDVGFGWKPVPLNGLVQMVQSVAAIIAYARGFVGVKPGVEVKRVSTEISQA